jgi:hypothetical protein
MALIAKPYDFSKFNERERKMIEFARQEAQKCAEVLSTSGN